MSIMRSRIRSSTVSIGTTATAVPTTALPGRNSMAIKNIGAATVYIGDDTVTTVNGYELEAGDSLPIDIGENVTVYGIVASGTVEVRILEGA